MSKYDSRKQQLIIASSRVLATNHGASLSEIAAQIGVGRATLQRYFPKRQDLLREIALGALREIDIALDAVLRTDLSPEESLQMMFELLAPIGDRYSYLVTYPDLMEFAEVASAYDRQLDRLNGFVLELKQKEVFSPDIPTAWIVQTIDLLIWGAWYAVDSGSVARNDAAQLAARTLIRGLGR
ncbi:MAG: TetR/AcrR family transcriptional regulator [Caldilineaceae bacterium]|uniref:TetR/AcrR family transcriptional regulator n=1 Tax=Caldilineaceae bacterium SB0675_bin_29 TaxID=2605266 RepID=A0A6B1G9N1_9CHLR|nr:TetR/AcrR family transcriptional regulator [Caldilineaceae bacterium]MYH63865.1 TetR/AcrR family transcriptional regulator [Caldilineaceae bacterium SB0675_bin_29]